MPAESERLRRRVHGRDRILIGVAAVLVAVGAPAGFLLGAGSGHAPPPNCVSTIVPGFMGGETHLRCGR